ncbi:rhodanese-like domain-containing protein [Aquisalinus flavus]|uniref:Sulfurtransferase n=1 Tax=Aquisalinus flavus TaxID=1526572 RepID=A0A8J2V7G8_9PROT|nr:rhodanese-like domain-containing protein [Aquisalinus flavus]MBD0426520.1 rhodanese-like domain-containing protein [Aquisalinus flavus]UNE47929.1 rhodanese-like domain-containing protein [Aquisalinus flavus]GGD07306.1 sulfurtransferase [Aquisalinus flavus]
MLRYFLISLCAVLALASCGAGAEPRYIELMPTQAVEMIGKDTGLTVLDVRTAEEFAAGHLPGAINIDYHADDFARQLATLPENRPVLVYCRSGNRSGKTVPLLRDLGFADIRHMNGGWLAWQDAGLAAE